MSRDCDVEPNRFIRSKKMNEGGGHFGIPRAGGGRLLT